MGAPSACVQATVAEVPASTSAVTVPEVSTT
jgi:hypothetical protein